MAGPSVPRAAHGSAMTGRAPGASRRRRRARLHWRRPGSRRTGRSNKGQADTKSGATGPVAPLRVAQVSRRDVMDRRGLLAGLAALAVVAFSQPPRQRHSPSRPAAISPAARPCGGRAVQKKALRPTVRVRADSSPLCVAGTAPQQMPWIADLDLSGS
jgi:hypothetical protein